MIIKKLKNRFGTIAVDKGFITPAQLTDALAIQAQENIEQGLLTASQIDEVLETMSNSMIYTLAAGR